LIAQNNFYFSNSSRFLSQYLTGDFPLTNTPSIVSGLSMGLNNGKKYQIDYNLHYSGSSTTEGVSIGFSGTNQAVYARGNLLINDYSKSPKTYAVTGYNQMNTSDHGDTSVSNILFNAFVVNGDNASTLHLLAAKETSGPNTVSITAGSWVTVTEY
jgi:hypothetical protein